MSKHTQGPWEAEHHKSEPPSAADDPGYWTIDGRVLADKFGPVADTLNRHHCISPDEDRANAKLMAAAPELLDACNGLLGLLMLIENRCDVELLNIIRTNHRVAYALTVTTKATIIDGQSCNCGKRECSQCGEDPAAYAGT